MPVGSFRKLVPAVVAFAGVLGSVAVYAAGPAVTTAQGARAADKTLEKSTGLTSHRATYVMALTKASQSDGVRAASGTMTYTLTDRCDGYTIETNLSLKLAFANGNENHIEQRYAAWEAKNGKSSTFRFQVQENGQLAKSYHGNIAFKDDGSGTATYETGDAPDGESDVQTFELQPGALLSTAHTLTLLKSAAAREKFVSKMVIDGSFDQGPFWVTAAIAAPHEDGVSPVKDDKNTLAEGRYWPVGMAYFPASSDREVPEYEISQNLLSTGITRSMFQDFGGFTLGFTPVKLEPINAPPC